MEAYYYTYSDGTEGSTLFKRDAQGNTLRDANGNAYYGEQTLVRERAPKAGTQLGAMTTGGGMAPARTPAPAPAHAPAPAPSPTGNGGATFGGTAATPAPAPAPAPAALNTPATWTITPDQTVAGQIAKLNDPNNPLVQQAQTQGLKVAASRGLLNSSMAQTGAMDSIYRAITPIATSDAETNAKAAGYNADQINQFSIVNANNASALQQAQMQIDAAYKQAQLQADTTKYTANLSAENNRAIAELNADSAQTVARLNIDAQAVMNSERNRHEALLQTSSFASSAYNQYANGLANIQIQPSMDSNAKAIAMQNLQDQYRAAMQAAYKLNNAGIPDFSGLLRFVSEEDMASNAATAGAQPPPPPPAPSGGEANPGG